MTTKIRSRMEALLGETEPRRAVEASDEDAMQASRDAMLKQIIPQLVLAMTALGLDPSDEEQLDMFMKTLKALATTKAQMVKTAIKNWAGAKAGKALRVIKKAV